MKSIDPTKPDRKSGGRRGTCCALSLTQRLGSAQPRLGLDDDPATTFSRSCMRTVKRRDDLNRKSLLKGMLAQAVMIEFVVDLD
jgi:hypothetical protein